jgi:uncharacterized protein (TIGR03435 family)
LFDIKLEWTPEPAGASAPGPTPDSAAPAADPGGPSIFTAIQEQLGLRLVSTKGSVDVLIIDSAQKPTLN